MAKAISALLVITIHVSAFCLTNSKLGSTSFKTSLVLNQISRSSVPLFVLFSGVGLTIAYGRKKSYISFITKRIGKIIPGYIIFGLIYLIIVNKDLSYSNYLVKFLKGDKVYYHLYFVPMIIKLYLIFPIIYYLMNRKPKLILIGSFFITFIITTSAHYFNKPDVTMEFFHKNNIMFWLFYFVLGIYIQPKIKPFINSAKKYRKSITLIYLLFTIFIIMESVMGVRTGKTVDYYTTFIRTTVIFYSLVTLVFLFSLEYKNKYINSALKIISINSYEIYLCHPLIIFYYMKLCDRLNIKIGSINFLISALIVTILISLIFSTTIKKSIKSIKKEGIL